MEAYWAACIALLLFFIDAPLILWRVHRRGWGRGSGPYHAANAIGILVGVAWLLALWRPPVRVEVPALVAWAGVLLAWAGIALCAWARLSMRAAFSPTAAVVAGQGVVDHGPFRFVRHPFYAGCWLVVAAGAPATGSVASLAAALLLIPVLQVLARHEEAILRSTFPSYAAYEERTGRFLPSNR